MLTIIKEFLPARGRLQLSLDHFSQAKARAASHSAVYLRGRPSLGGAFQPERVRSRFSARITALRCMPVTITMLVMRIVFSATVALQYAGSLSRIICLLMALFIWSTG